MICRLCRTASGRFCPAYRAVYCAKYRDTVFILHAFTKTTNGVDRTAMNTARERYREMVGRIGREGR
ncbi:MAG: type II toxin-antitoxin system RelE/ParE family toxin [Arenimonas sp.]|nr:type II toxin-antitoxin system RelE/ParE family toxin [Arenimonas sp.]